MNERYFLWVALAFYATAGALTLRRLRGGGDLGALHRLNLMLMLAGFALHTVFLSLRGQELRRCPLTNLFEAQAFVAWAAVLFYLLIGTSYRVSFLGAFTAPVISLIVLAGLVAAPDNVNQATSLTRSPWVEFHAAIAVLAYGAFALGAVASAMYLMQERQLKTRKLGPSFLLLPPIDQLDAIGYRLLLMGFVMLTAGMVGGVVSYKIVGHWTTLKIVWAVAVWVMYAALVLLRSFGRGRGRKVAWVSIAAFVVALGTFWGVSLLSNFLG